LQDLVNGLAAYALIAAAAAVLLGGIAWALGARIGLGDLSDAGRRGIVAGLGLAFLVGAAAGILRYFSDLGARAKEGQASAAATERQRWSIVSPGLVRAEPVGEGRCEFSLRGKGPLAGEDRWVTGMDILIHVRRTGDYAAEGVKNCRIAVTPDDRLAGLPLTLDPTAGSGASPAFAASAGFTVKVEGGEKCGATAFRSATGEKVGRYVDDGESRQFDGPGEFYVVTDVFGCRVQISSR
jgi:hypothetical protein